jgi:hypothetical protein
MDAGGGFPLLSVLLSTFFTERADARALLAHEPALHDPAESAYWA